MDVDAYVAVRRADWERLEALLVRPRRWSPADADEVVALYRRVATDLSVVRSASPDPELLGRLSALVARARSAVTGTASPAWRDAARFLTVGFPVALAASWRWWAGTLVASVAVMVAVGAWVASSPDVIASLATPETVRSLVEEDFESYYSESPANAFAAQVLTNNAYIAAACLVTGVLILPVLYILFQNVLNIGVTGGIMVAHGRGDLFFGLITPHGLLELTAVFVAAGAGMRLGWAWIDPGPRRRVDALAAEGRVAAGMALGVALLLAVSAVIEAFVTPSALPTVVRVGIGVLAWLLFLAYVLHGARLRRAGETADVSPTGPSASAPIVG